MLRNWLEPRILGTVAVAAFVLWVFIEVAEEVTEGSARRIDTAILMAFRSPADPADPLGPPWLGEFVRDVSGLGSSGVLGLLVSGTVIALLLIDQRRTVVFVSAATLGGALVATLLKQVFDRPRPDMVPHGTFVYDSSFPSGHAMMSAVVYLTLGALVTPLLPGRRLKLYVMALAAILTAMVGVSRIYLGVHWPSDVLAGWAAGAVWALGCWVAAEIVNRRNGATS